MSVVAGELSGGSRRPRRPCPRSLHLPCPVAVGVALVCKVEMKIPMSPRSSAPIGATHACRRSGVPGRWISGARPAAVNTGRPSGCWDPGWRQVRQFTATMFCRGGPSAIVPGGGNSSTGHAATCRGSAFHVLIALSTMCTASRARPTPVTVVARPPRLGRSDLRLPPIAVPPGADRVLPRPARPPERLPEIPSGVWSAQPLPRRMLQRPASVAFRVPGPGSLIAALVPGYRPGVTVCSCTITCLDFRADRPVADPVAGSMFGPRIRLQRPSRPEVPLAQRWRISCLVVGPMARSELRSRRGRDNRRPGGTSPVDWPTLIHPRRSSLAVQRSRFIRHGRRSPLPVASARSWCFSGVPP